MKKAKRLVSIILAALLVMASLTAAAGAQTKKGNEYPVILVIGRGAYTPYYGDDGKQIFPIRVDMDFVLEKVKECLPILGKGLVSGDLKPWAQKVAEVIAPLYADLIPETDADTVKGGPVLLNGYGHNLTAGTSGYDYSFNYDWRRDPSVSAAFLDEYIQQIKEATGCEKVSLVGRCYGANVVSAYLYEYGHDDIDTVIYYCSTALGCYSSACLFSGDIAVEPSVMQSFLENNELIDDPVITEIIRSAVGYINSFYGLELPMDAVKLFVKKVFPALAPELFPVCYGSMSCFWDMVDNGRYEKAKKLICVGNEDKLSAVIEKADHYHYDIMAGMPEMLKKYADEGLNVGVIAKYGCDAQYPIYDNGNPQSDNTVELAFSTFGATSSEYGKTLSKKYLKSADMAYVSSDNCVDASSALFKDSTWIIKNIDHSSFPVCIDELMCSICNFDGQMTTKDVEKYPQFLSFESDSLVPLDEQPVKNAFAPISTYFKALIRLIKAVIAALPMVAEALAK